MITRSLTQTCTRVLMSGALVLLSALNALADSGSLMPRVVPEAYTQITDCP